MLTLSRERILVTGASSGIGRAIATVCAQAGATVIASGRSKRRLEETVAGLSGAGHSIEDIDLLEEQSIADWLKEVAHRGGPISGVVHSAGVLITKPARMISKNDWDRSWRLNVEIAGTLAAALHQKNVKADTASIVFVSSVMGLVGQPGQSLYGATKGAVVAMTKSLALEYAKQSTRVNCVAPGVVDTPMTDRYRSMVPVETFAEIQRLHPLGLGTPDDVANAVAFLMSPLARWITGTTVVVDGGYTAQ